MGIFSNKISREELKPGDHIYSWRTAYVYAHHGDGKVIHFTRGGRETYLDRLIVSSCVKKTPCLVCRDGSSVNDGVISSCLDCFLAGGKLYLFEYDVSWVKFLAKPRSGTSTLAPSDPPEEVLSRANFLLLQNVFGAFDVFDKNCEDFALYCKTGLVNLNRKGMGNSGQAYSARAASLAALVAGVGFPLAGIGTYCIYRLGGDIGTGISAIKIPVEGLVSMMNMAKNDLEMFKLLLLDSHLRDHQQRRRSNLRSVNFTTHYAI